MQPQPRQMPPCHGGCPGSWSLQPCRKRGTRSQIHLNPRQSLHLEPPLLPQRTRGRPMPQHQSAAFPSPRRVGTRSFRYMSTGPQARRSRCSAVSALLPASVQQMRAAAVQQQVTAQVQPTSTQQTVRGTRVLGCGRDASRRTSQSRAMPWRRCRGTGGCQRSHHRAR